MVEIKQVIRLHDAAGGVIASTLDMPAGGSRFPSFELPISGWIAASRPVRAVEARGHGTVWNLPLISRSDVTNRFHEIPEQQRTGFHGNVTSLRLPRAFEVVLVVAFDNGEEIAIGRVRGSRVPLAPGFSPTLQPLMLNCLGRSGSTWVTHVLGHHPKIVSYQSFRLEPRVAGYWLDVLGALAEPSSYTQSLQPEVTGEDWWTGRERRKALSLHHIDEDMACWLGGDAVESLATFCMSRVDEFYKAVAQRQGKADARFFVERSYGIGSFAPGMLRELYPDHREVFLIRDFRDVYCSMRSFKGSSLPRRHLAADEGDYIRNHLREYINGLYKSWSRQQGVARLLRYEDLVQRPLVALTELFKYLGVTEDPETVSAVYDSALSALPERQAAHRTTSDPLASIGRWRKELAPELQHAFAESMGDMLEAFGYPLTSKLSLVSRA